MTLSAGCRLGTGANSDSVASPLQVSAFSTWEKELHKVVFDPRYLLLNSEERKQVPGGKAGGRGIGMTRLGARLADRCRRPGEVWTGAPAPEFVAGAWRGVEEG